jgi:restriction endonuclease S subunit
MRELQTLRLDELISQGAIQLGRGDVISKDDIAEHPGPYPIYSSSAQNNGKFGEYGKYMFDEELITWSVDGGGHFFYRDRHLFSVTNVCGFMRVNDKRLHPKFVFYSLAHQHRSLTFDYTDKAHPSVIRKRYRLPDIGMTQQKRIASILTSIDAAIEKTEALIAKHQQIKAGLMHDLFTRGVLPNGQLRPPRNEAPELYQQTALGWIPKEWRAERLGAMLDESGGYLQTGPFGSQLHASEYSDEGVPVVMPQDINDGLIDEVAIARIGEERATTLARHRLKVGDIIIARRGELSRAAAISDLHANWVCGTGCFLLRLGRTGLNHFFFSLAYRFDYVQRQIAGMQVGSTMPSLNNSVMSRVFFPRPSPSEQDEITRRLHAVEIEIAGIAHQAEKLQKQKLGLMQDLLTGRVPVPAALEPAEAAT